MPHGRSYDDAIISRLDAILRARAYPRDSRYLVALLEDVQTEFGFVPEQSLTKIAHYFALAEAEVKTWFDDATVLRSRPLARHVLKVCGGPVCGRHGGARLLVASEALLHGSHDCSLVASQCLGRCHEAPAVMLDSSVLAPAAEASLRALLHTGGAVP